VIVFQDIENLTVIQSLANRVNSDAIAAGQPNPNYTGVLAAFYGYGAGGLLVRSSAVSINSITELEEFTTYTDSGGTSGVWTLWSSIGSPPVRLRGTTSKNGQLLDFTVFVVQLVPSNSSNFSSTRRAAQANNVAKIIQDELTSNPGARILVIGDFNAFEVNDGYVDAMNTILGTPAPPTQVAAGTLDPTYPNLTNLLSLVPLSQRYSSIVEGNRQTTDHALLNPAALGQLVGGGYARVNADFPEVFRNDFNRPERYGTFDPVFAYLTTAANVTAQTTVSRAGIIYNRAALTATTRIVVRNNTLNTMVGPLNVVITGLTDGVTLTNANSTTGAGAIYNLPVPLAPGQSVTVNLDFSIDAVKPINYTVNVFSGTL
jgi:hypothetical protein